MAELEVTDYRYDSANRLTAVVNALSQEGQAHTWDANGNLLDDGQKQYRYDQADRLIGVTGQDLAWSASYDGDGVRLGQVVNGAPITYTVDLAGPLVTVLAQQTLTGTAVYLYGLGDSPLAARTARAGRTWRGGMPEQSAGGDGYGRGGGGGAEL